MWERDALQPAVLESIFLDEFILAAEPERARAEVNVPQVLAAPESEFSNHVQLPRTCEGLQSGVGERALSYRLQRVSREDDLSQTRACLKRAPFDALDASRDDYPFQPALAKTVKADCSQTVS